jgi:hypothetical protein
VGALSLIPGGIGAYEASVLGLLVAIRLDLLRNLGTSLSPASCATDQSLNNSSSRLSYLGPRASVIALTTSGDGTAWSA